MIKIENRAFPDAARVGYGGKLSHSFVAGSRNKRSFGVNLRTPEGVALLKRLVAGADVVLENFKPGTLEKLGLGYESLRAVKPDIVMLSTNALGSTGPWSRWLGYGPIVRCVSGIASLWRYPEDELGFGEPTTIYPDHYGARVCATTVLAALVRQAPDGVRRLRRERAGRADRQPARRRLPRRLARRRDDPARRGASTRAPATTSGASSPSATTSSGWRCAASSANRRGRPPQWRASPTASFSTATSAEWTRTRSPRAVMETLQAAGVPAAMMMRPDDHEQDPHLLSRGVWREMDQPGLGVVRMENGPFRSRSIPPVRVSPAPQHGEHTREICATVLGLSQPEIEALFAAGVLEEPLPTPAGALAA